MNRIIAITALVLLPLTGCVTTGKFRAEVAKKEAAEKQAQDIQAALDALKKSNEAQKAELDAAKAQVQTDKTAADDLQAKLKADEDQIAALQKSNQELEQSLEARKGDLSKKVAHLIKERDELQAQLRDLKQKPTAVSETK